MALGKIADRNLAAKAAIDVPSWTNLFLRSEEFDHALWLMTAGATVVANAGAAPGGAMTADRLVGGSSVNASTYQQVTVVPGAAYTFSLYVKNETAAVSRIQFVNGAGTSRGILDITWSGAVLATATGIVGSVVEVVGNGWYRIIITGSSDDTGLRLRIYPDRATSLGQSILIWGAQAVAGYDPRPYVATVAAPVTLTPSWSGDLPLANLIDDERFIAAPSRHTTPGGIGGAPFVAVLAQPRVVDLVALLFHTLSLTATCRVRIVGPGGNLGAPAWDSGWRDVFGRIYDSLSLDWEATNWWTGQGLDSEDLDLYARHLWVGLDTGVLAAEIHVELRDPDNPAGFLDVGGLWIAQTWSPRINFERGREPEVRARDQGEEGPSGRLFPEERGPRRQLSLTWKRLADGEAQRLFDMGARARTTRTVLVLPDIDDPASLLREAFPAVFDPLPAITFIRNGSNVAVAGFKEIIA